jgi:hypothetical protein
VVRRRQTRTTLDDDTLLEGHVPLSVKSFSLTDTGKVRETNEDSS